MKDEAEQKAIELLPCVYACEETEQGRAHALECPWKLRPAIAAALREAQDEMLQAYVRGLERATELCVDDNLGWEVRGFIQAEIAKAKAGKP